VTTIVRKPAGRLAALTLAAVLTAGCGSDSTPADAAPELAEQLARVDRAVATGEERQIRERVDGLVAATESARESGRLDDEQADRILAAADALLAQLPAEEPTTESPPPPPSPPTLSPSPDEDDGDEAEAEKEREKAKKKRAEEAKKRAEEAKKRAEEQRKEKDEEDEDEDD
jgi:outer membrane biosynthesis protein TonB